MMAKKSRKSEYDKKVLKEMVKPIKRGAEEIFKKYKLGRPKIIVVTNKPKARK